MKATKQEEKQATVEQTLQEVIERINHSPQPAQAHYQRLEKFYEIVIYEQAHAYSIAINHHELEGIVSNHWKQLLLILKRKFHRVGCSVTLGL